MVILLDSKTFLWRSKLLLNNLALPQSPTTCSLKDSVMKEPLHEVRGAFGENCVRRATLLFLGMYKPLTRSYSYYMAQSVYSRCKKR